MAAAVATADTRTAAATGTAQLLEVMAALLTAITLLANMLMGRHQWLG
jgi:hypothetical protein